MKPVLGWDPQQPDFCRIPNFHIPKAWAVLVWITSRRKKKKDYGFWKYLKCRSATRQLYLYLTAANWTWKTGWERCKHLVLFFFSRPKSPLGYTTPTRGLRELTPFRLPCKLTFEWRRHRKEGLALYSDRNTVTVDWKLPSAAWATHLGFTHAC